MTFLLNPYRLGAAFTPGTQNFAYTGAFQNFVVPAGVTILTVDLYGAEGGTAAGAGVPGKGGRVKCDVPVTPGETLRVYVGGAGIYTNGQGSVAGGFNGGGTASMYAGSGGGATDVRRTPYALSDRLVVAGAGGGSGGAISGVPTGYGQGGGGASPTGNSGVGGEPPPTRGTGGTGGTTSAGGTGGTHYYSGSTDGTVGTLGVGGNGGDGNTNGGGGGGAGGGRYGGGGGGGSSGSTPTASAGGGGGGSGLSTGVAETLTSNTRSGNGVADLTW